MSKPAAKGHTAVRNQRQKRISDGEPWQQLDFLPTPPWATRALCEIVLPAVHVPKLGLVREPCAGLRHMADPLGEYALDVWATDVFLYDRGLDIEQRDYLGDETDRTEWTISNPPYKTAQQILLRALERSSYGVALLLRFNWVEGIERYAQVFTPHMPTLVAPFAERVAMCEGGWDPDLSTATCYAWFVWVRDAYGQWIKPARAGVGRFDGLIIPPGCRERFTRESDRILAARHVPGWVSPRLLKKVGREQHTMEFA